MRWFSQAQSSVACDKEKFIEKSKTRQRKTGQEAVTGIQARDNETSKKDNSGNGKKWMVSRTMSEGELAEFGVCERQERRENNMSRLLLI